MRPLGLVVCLLAVGCVPTSYALTPSSNRALSPKPEGCTFETLTAAPDKTHEEIAQLDHYNGDVPKSIDGFRSAVAKQVCRTGGDAVIAVPNDKGGYSKGTIIVYTRRPTPSN